MFAGLTNISNCDIVNLPFYRRPKTELEIFVIFAWLQKNSEKQREPLRRLRFPSLCERRIPVMAV